MPHQPSFEQAFTSLLEHLRQRPEDDRQTRRLVATLGKTVAAEGMTVEAGLVRTDTLHDPGIRGRMLARRVETLRVSAGAPDDELLALAEALAVSDLTIPTTRQVAVEFVVDVQPGQFANQLPSARSEAEAIELVDNYTTAADRGPRLREGPGEELERIQAAIRTGAERGSWTDALHAAQALTVLPQQFPESRRRQLIIAARRVLSRSVLRGFMEHGMRVPEEQARVVQVLEWAGPDTAEVILDYLTETPGVGPKMFLFEAVSRMPDVYPMLGPLLRSQEAYKSRLGADLLSRSGNPKAIIALTGQLQNPDERVRVSVIRALSHFDQSQLIEPLRQALSDPAVSVRISAAEALAGRGAAGVVPALAQAIEVERDPKVAAALLDAIVQVDSAEGSMALATIALTKRTLLRRRGFRPEQRLAAIAALAGSRSRSATAALERVAEEAGGAVGQAARDALGSLAG